MKLTVFSPVHETSLPYLRQAFRSLGMQSKSDRPDFEWLILTNGGLTAQEVGEQSGWRKQKLKDVPWVRIEELTQEDDVHRSEDGHGSIGQLKRECCNRASGDILIEMDADDMLTPNALKMIHAAFEDENVMFVYSGSCEFKHDTWEANLYSEAYGWSYRPFVYKEYNGKGGIDRPLLETRAFAPDANTMRRIEWAPNHVRAWRKEAYFEVGGHNPSIKTGDDHDLVCRTYLKYGARGFKMIDAPLYMYRIHGKNSCYTHNADVQARVAVNYDQYYEKMALRDAQQKGLLSLDLGGRFNCPKFEEEGLRYTTVDLIDGDMIANLEEKWPWSDNSVGVLRAHHLLEHLSDPIHAMNEAARVLAPGGVFFIEVPSTDGRGAFQDPTHKGPYWNENSFWYYTKNTHAVFIRPMYKGRFMASRVETVWWDEHIAVVRAELINIKDGYRPPGLLEI